MDLDPGAVLELQRRAFRDFLALVGGLAPNSSFVDLDGGIRASIAPSTPERSIVNSVAYADPAALAASIDRLAAIYEQAGVCAWTVWVPDGDELAAAALERAGHAIDGRPVAMALELDRLEAGEIGDLEWVGEASFELIGRLNDEAYGLAHGGGFAAALRSAPAEPQCRTYQALVDGEPASVLATIDHPPRPGAAGPDCGIYFVATPERFRGRGLASRLLAVALAEARERGCVTSSLQASPMGELIYVALGYRRAFDWRMYERRA